MKRILLLCLLVLATVLAAPFVFILALATFATPKAYAAGFSGLVCDPGGDLSAKISWGVAHVTPEMMGNAVLIVATGAEMKVPVRGQVIAVATALQESGLINNPNALDHDSLGLFQQRPSQGWGTAAQILNPRYAATKFYERLVRVPDWEQLPLTVAAQTVQRSAFPDAYAQWEALAGQIVGRAAHVSCTDLLASASGRGAVVAAAALRWLGTPYVFAAGNEHGPTTGTTPGVGFDCSGLALYAWAQVGVRLPHYTVTQYQKGVAVPRGQEAPGDLLFFHAPGDPPGYVHHVGIYIGDGKMVHAPDVGDVVKISDVFGSAYWMSEYAGARRYG